MKHLMICREFPPAPSGGIGIYAAEMSRLLASHGETVHVIGQLWEKAAASVEQRCDGRLIIHRIPYEDGASLLPPRPHPRLQGDIERALFRSDYPPQSFAWQVACLAEMLIENEGIDVVEAPEYEAPLYYFQLRRALGQGPRQRPPCLVHLHSPTELIARHNNWDPSLPHVKTAIELENYSIAKADSLICPSRYLAQQVEELRALAPGSVQSIPYPIGAWTDPPRSRNQILRQSVCFVGRLEPRKGVYEWVDAAIAVAGEFPKATFEFIGGDTLDRGRSVRALLESRIPRSVRSRFRFHGERPRHSLEKFLAAARISVVPSRWDNYPFTCMEAMASGLPVIATQQGGMAEMISDGVTGWLAESAEPQALAETLRRALNTPADRTAEMARLAAIEIRRICNNRHVIEAHLAHRKQLVQVQEATTSSVRSTFSVPTGGARFDGEKWVTSNGPELWWEASARVWRTTLSHVKVMVTYPGFTARHVRTRLKNKLFRRMGSSKRWFADDSR